ncbi:hypothetical protein J0H58_19050 [bacterium]|nr:hypothetical protein [bacterium]
MIRKLLVCGVVVVALGAGARSQEPAAKTAAPANPTFEKLKGMVGTWVEADKDGKPTEKVVSVARLTAGGSTITETLFPGTPMEMMSVYHLDGADVVMTHYCMLGNQPRMKAAPGSAPNQIRWVFTGGSNLDVAKDAHMHGAVVTFLNSDTVEIAGEAWEGGKPSPNHCGTMKLVRKK